MRDEGSHESESGLSHESESAKCSEPVSSPLF